MATVFVGSLLMYLVVTAVPAMAVVASCVVNANTFQLDVQVGTDNTTVLAVNGADDIATLADNSYVFSVNGGAFADCTGTATTAAISFVNLQGAGDGNETAVLFHADGQGVGNSMAGELFVVDLGNGNDTLRWEYGALASPVLADSAADNTLLLGASAAGVTLGDQSAGGATDMRIDNAENLVVNGGNLNDTLRLDQSALAADPGNAGITADDQPASTQNVQQGVVFNGGADSGTDTLFSGDGSDTFNAGGGVDTVDYGASPAGVTIDLTAGTSTGQGTDVLSDVQIAFGSNFADTITGSSTDNTLDGRDGNDVISGLAGNDTISGGADGPDADASGGNDTLTGGTGNDSVAGGDGDDLIDEEAAANGADVLSGGSGDEVAGDTLDHSKRTVAVAVTAGAGGANDGADVNGDGDSSDAGEEGDNVDATFENYLGGTGADTYVGHAGGETFVPGAGNDKVTGGAGTDLLDVSASVTAATINLETGTATSDQGTDTFLTIEQFATGSANDVLIPDIQTGIPAGFDWFADGGIDLVDGSTNTSGFFVDLSVLGDPVTGPGGGCSGIPSPSAQDAGGGSCTIVENATGGAGNDTLIGSPTSNVLLGGAGIDAINGDAGNDLVVGGAGNDNLGGGTGADTLSYVDAPSGEVIDLQLGFASGGDGDDALGFFEIVLGSDFNDQINGGQTSLDANLRVRGRGGNDLITGTNSVDTLAGGTGNDVIRAGGGDDIGRGGGGNDALFGSSGDDFLFGGAGTDEANGGRGNDRCRAESKTSC